MISPPASTRGQGKSPSCGKGKKGPHKSEKEGGLSLPGRVAVRFAMASRGGACAECVERE